MELMKTGDQIPFKTSPVQNIFCILLGEGLLFAGTAHLTTQRVEFLAQVPGWLPLDGDLVVVASGIVEIILGAALILAPARYRQMLGWGVAAFFVLIFPGNISQYTNRIDAFGLNTDQARLMRLFFQPVFVVLALWSTGAWQSWRRRRASRQVKPNQPPD
jgi:uncharacterized membrane protein